MSINFIGGVLFVLIVLYWWLLFRLVGAILDSPRLKQWHWLIIGIANALILIYIWRTFPNALLVYGAMMILMIFEFIIFYRDSFAGSLLCTLACTVHVIAIFMITLGTFSLSTGRIPLEILGNNRAFFMCSIGAFFLLDVAIVGVIKLVPLPKVRLINQHKEQQWFIIAWMAVSSIFLVYMGILFYSPTYPAYLSGSQVAAALALMLGLYIVLFFSIKTSEILGYKEKNLELEEAFQKEQQYRKFMVRDAIAYYEVNVTQDVFVKGFEEYHDSLGDVTCSYTEMLTLMSQKTIYAKDVSMFVNNHGRTKILELFEKGQRELIREYRRISGTGGYIWVRSIANLMKDAETGDVKAFVCIKNIDNEKRIQLELQYQAERDPLTDLYNRSAATKLINEQIAFSKEQDEYALFMIDIDNFKEINDNLGHIYGDAVLCELADKLTQIFSNDDIIGRIGGDEYIVFLKDNATKQNIQSKVREISKVFHVTYQGINNEKLNLSSSIGISLFPRDGNNFKELYGHADVALYAAKVDGKNRYKIYDGRTFAPYISKRTEIQTVGNVSQKGFRENRIEYVFKMLYQSENPVMAIHSVLELVARHFSFERGYIFETSNDGKTSSNTFEWCEDGVTPQIDKLQNVPIELMATANARFQQVGTFVLKSLDDLQGKERSMLESQGIKSMFQFGIFDKCNLIGIIGFDNCINEIIQSDTDIDEIKTICNLLSTFIVKEYVDEASKKELLARQEVMNNIGNYIYVINIISFEVLFMNQKIQELLDGAEEETTCYSFFRGEPSQCKDCPLLKMDHEDIDCAVAEAYNDKLEIWMEISASLMRWTDGTPACLISCTDITNQKEAHLKHVNQLESLLYVDALTGGRTYQKFEIDAQQILDKHPDALRCIIKLDIANFKLINRLYGFEKGDEVLCCVAKAIAQTTRNENEIFARVHDDEFVALFTIENKAEIEVLNKTFEDGFYRLMGESFVFQCRFTHGRYVIERREAKKITVKDVFERVNTAHKMAKLDKIVDFAFYDEQMTKDALRVKDIENKMNEALNGNEFHIYLQPKYYLEGETIGGAEALCRWGKEDDNNFSPNSFIPIFEQNGFIEKLDFYIFKKTCQIIKMWITQGIEPVRVSVNFSRKHLGNVNFVKQLCEIADKVGIERKYLEIEITETAIFDNIDTLELLLKEIHQSGFTLSMDDFGSGYSSLGMLKDFHFDVLKMDRSFFANQRDVERSKTVVGSIIQMAVSLKIEIVAEGVEDQAQIDFLRELGCDMVQGYYYAKPMTINNFTKLLRKEKEAEK